MAIKRNDLFFLFLSVIFASIGAIVITNPNALVALSLVAALLGIGLIIAIYVRPNLGSVVLIVAVFTNISRTFTDNGLPGITKPLVAIVAFAILARYFNSPRVVSSRQKTSGIEFYLGFFFLATAISYLAAEDKARALAAILDLGKDIVIIYCILFTLRRLDIWKQSAWIIILITTFLCLLGAYQVISGNYDQEFFGLARVVQDVGSTSTTYRIAGPIKEPNIWGGIVVAVVPLVLYRVIYEQSLQRKLILAGILGILLFGILNSYSRGAYLALAVVVILTLFRQRQNPLFWLIGLSTAIFVISIMPSSYRERFQSLFLLAPTNQNGIYQESSFRGRSSEMLTGLAMFTEHPLMGVGAGNYPNNYQKYTHLVGLELRSGERDPHSLYVQILAETGIIGAIAFAGFSILLIINLHRARRSIEHLSIYQSWGPWVSAIQLTIVGYLLISIFLHGAYLRYFWIFVALAMSAIQLSDAMLMKSERSLSQGTSV